MTDRLRDRVIVAVGTHYLIDGEIGRGGMAVVYRAVDLRLHRPVALKVLPPELAFDADVRARFLREAQTAAQLAHPHIVPIYAVDEADGIVYFVMGLVDGESLAALLAREPRQPVDRVARTLREVADALAYAHDRGVVHRDVKPDNIIIERGSGRAIVTDFGIARAAAESRLTITGAAVGTPAYMSPEQAMGEREVDGRSDIYSLGVVGYQMLAGETPFRATNTPAMLMKHVSEPPPPLRDRRPDVPPVLAAAIERALAKNPADRWPTARDLHDALAGDLHVVHSGRTPPWMHHAVRSSARAGALPPAPAPVAPVAPVPDPGQSPMLQLPFPVAVGWSGREWRQWAREQRHAARALEIARWSGPPTPEQRQADERWHLARRVTRFRRSIVATVVGVPLSFLAGVSMHAFPVFAVPSAILCLQLFARTGLLWADGISPFMALRFDWRDRLLGRQAIAPAPVPANAPAAEPRAAPRSLAPLGTALPLPAPDAGREPLAPPDVLAGPFGQSVRRAADDRAAVVDIVGRLSPVERELLPPDIGRTADALAGRVASLATMLHHLDNDVSGSSLAQIDGRIEALLAEAPTPDRDRHLTLLQRQRNTVHDLLERRRTLANQLESASLVLQNLKLDMFKLRSAGVGAALQDVTSVTQEARALSRDIGHLIEAADDVRKL